MGFPAGIVPVGSFSEGLVMSAPLRGRGRALSRGFIAATSSIVVLAAGIAPAQADELQPAISGAQLLAAPSGAEINVPAPFVVTDGSSAPFSREAAQQWALSHSQDPNPFPAACTWFASQVLWAGGIPQSSEWTSDGSHGRLPYFTQRPGTAAATAVEPFISSLLSTYPRSTFSELSMTQNAVPQAQVGDVIAYDWEGDWTFDHIAVITGFASGDYPLVSEWGVADPRFGNLHPATQYSQRGWTYSEKSSDWLQSGHPSMRAALLHIDTTIPSTY